MLIPLSNPISLFLFFPLSFFFSFPLHPVFSFSLFLFLSFSFFLVFSFSAFLSFFRSLFFFVSFSLSFFFSFTYSAPQMLTPIMEEAEEEEGEGEEVIYLGGTMQGGLPPGMPPIPLLLLFLLSQTRKGEKATENWKKLRMKSKH